MRFLNAVDTCVLVVKGTCIALFPVSTAIYMKKNNKKKTGKDRAWMIYSLDVRHIRRKCVWFCAMLCTPTHVHVHAETGKPAVFFFPTCKKKLAVETGNEAKGTYIHTKRVSD